MNDSEPIRIPEGRIVRDVGDIEGRVRDSVNYGEEFIRVPISLSDFLLARIAEDDPARVLAECEAKRQILEIHYNGSPEVWPERCSLCDTQTEPCGTLRALASVYADHPDYREEWRV